MYECNWFPFPIPYIFLNEETNCEGGWAVTVLELELIDPMLVFVFVFGLVAASISFLPSLSPSMSIFISAFISLSLLNLDQNAVFLAFTILA